MLLHSANKQDACTTETVSAAFNLAAAGGAISILGLVLSVAGIGLATLLIYIGLGLFFVGNFRVHKGGSQSCYFLNSHLCTVKIFNNSSMTREPF